MRSEGDSSYELYQLSRNMRVLEAQRSETCDWTQADGLDYLFVKNLFHGYRGGIATSLVTPENSTDIPFSPEFERKSGFTPDQRRYARKTLAFLNSFMRGTPISGINHGAQLSKRIENQVNQVISFQDAIVNGYLDGLRDFCFAYPKLAPVLAAIYNTGGIKATLKAIDHSAGFLDDAYEGSLNRANEKGFKTLPSSVFFKRHLKTVGRGKNEIDFEIHCAGQALATTIVNQSKHAAITISETSFTEVLPNSPFEYEEISYTRKFRARMTGIQKELEDRFQPTS